VPPCFLNVPVDAQIEWPRKEAVATFGACEIIVFPPSPDHDASLHIDLRYTHLSDLEAGSVLSQFLSIAAWIDDAFAVLLPGWSGNPIPCRPKRQTRSWPSSILDSWCNAWHPIADERSRRAVAIYREAMNMQHFHSLPYAVLGFYKILESAYPDGRERAERLEEWVADFLARDGLKTWELREIGFDLNTSPKQIADFLYREGRQAVAHANKDPTVDPDDIGQQRQMSVAASILRAAARSWIKSRFRVGTNRWDQTVLS
jgi:Methylamine utilization protein MauJ